MGGSFKSHGNCSPVAEYNYWCDPEAAKICYEMYAEAGKKILAESGLNITAAEDMADGAEKACRLAKEVRA